MKKLTRLLLSGICLLSVLYFIGCNSAENKAKNRRVDIILISDFTEAEKKAQENIDAKEKEQEQNKKDKKQEDTKK